MNAGRPTRGSKVRKAPDREIGKPGENRGKVIAHRDLQPTAAFHDRENRRNLCVTPWNRHVVSKEVAGVAEGNRNRISEILSVFCNDPAAPFFVFAFLRGISCLTNCGLFSSNRSFFLRRTPFTVGRNTLEALRRILRLL